VHQVTVNWSHERSSVGGDSRDNKQSHALENLAQLNRAQPTVVRDDVTQVRTCVCRALVEHLL
jgi:hypothetical protein